MNRQRASLAANPVLLGAAAVLVAVIAVVLAYNANSGLPFVQTYDLRMRVTDAKKLTTGTDVRVAGKRIGQVNAIEVTPPSGRTPAFSTLELSLDRASGPLPIDTTARIRPKSVIGAKYVEITPGRSRRTIASGGVLPTGRTSASTDLDEVLGAFDSGTRRGVRTIVNEAGNGVAGRGAGLNDALGDLPPVLSRTARVADVLNDPATDLGGFVRGAAGALGAIEPRATDLGPLLRDASVTLDAFTAERDALADTLDTAPGTLAETERASGRLRPVLREAAALSRALRAGSEQVGPTARRLRITVQDVRPVLRDAPVLGRRLDQVLDQVDDLVTRPTFTPVFDRVAKVTPNATSVLNQLDGLQTRCNYVGLFARNIQEVLGEGDKNGNWFRFSLQADPGLILRTAEPPSNLHTNVYPDFGSGCALGNENYRPSNAPVYGPGPGPFPQKNITTAIPASVPEGPR
jgi:virulence factor Mce-like protein